MINWIGEVGERSKVASRTGREQRARSVIGPTAGATTHLVRLAGAARLLIDAFLASRRNRTCLYRVTSYHDQLKPQSMYTR